MYWVVGSRDNSVEQSGALYNARNAGRRVHQTLPPSIEWLDHWCVYEKGRVCCSVFTDFIVRHVEIHGVPCRPLREIHGISSGPRFVQARLQS